MIRSSMTRSSGLLLASLCALQIGNGLHATAFLAFAGLFFREKFGLSATDVSVLVSTAILVYGVGQFLVSLLLDVGVRLAGRRWLLLRSPIVFLIGWVLMAYGTGPSVVVLGGGLIGLGGASVPLILAILAEQTDRKDGGFVAGLVNAVQLAGQLLALAIGLLLVSHGQLRAVFPSVAAMWLAMTILLFATLPADRPTLAGELPFVHVVADRFRLSARELWRSFLDPETRLIKVLMMIAGVAPLLASTYLPLYLLALVRDPVASAAYISASTAIGYLLGTVLTPALGAFSDRRENKPSLLLGVLVLLAVALLAVGGTRDPLVVSVLAVAVTVASQWLNALQNGLLMNLATEERGTTFFLANQLPFYAGLPLGLLLAISTIKLTGSVVNALLLVAGMFAVGAIIWAPRVLRGMRRAPAPDAA